MNETASAIRPMWCDDFDMDLPKVIPDALALLGDVADVKLYTHGSLTNGALNHPSVWNHDVGLVAFFGFSDPGKPESYYTPAPVVECTFWEAVRDAWPHGFTMLVRGRHVLDTNALWPQFEKIMWNIRGWGVRDDAGADVARSKVRWALVEAADNLRRLRPL